MTQEFYERAKKLGIDYNYYGDWQKQYVKMVVSASEIMRRTHKAHITCLDVGCACGVNTRAFKELGIFGRVWGNDVSEYMLDLGRETHNLTEEELFFAPAWDIQALRSGSVDLLHCSHVLEHIPKSETRLVTEEFRRLLSPKGVGFILLDAITDTYAKKEIEQKEETHVNVQTVRWWIEELKRVFKNVELNPKRYAEDKHYPDLSNRSKNFAMEYPYWTVLLVSR